MKRRKMRLRGIIVCSLVAGVLALQGSVYLIERNFDASKCMAPEATKISETSISETNHVVTTFEKDGDKFNVKVREKYVRYAQLNVHTSPILTQDLGYDNVSSVLEKNDTVYVLDNVSFSDPRTNRLWYYITNEDGSKVGWVVSDGLS